LQNEYKVKTDIIIMKLLLKILLVAAIATLLYMCVQSILTPINFTKQKEVREKAISERLIAIRNAQIGFRSQNGVYAGTFDELKKFLKEQRIPFIIKEGELSDEQLKAGMTEKEAVVKGIIRRDTNWVLAKDTLLGVNYNVDIISKVPGFENESFSLDTATLSSPSGYTVPVFEAGVLYEVYLKDLDRQLLINLKDKTTKLNRFLGLRVGSVTEINNNAGNWE
jgi:hypothetical protein